MKRQEPFRILYEDERLAAIDKAPGISVIADRWDDSRERLDELLNSFFTAEAAEAAAAQPPRPSRVPFPHRVLVVHRIDRDTSGLVVFAKNAEAHRALSAAFEAREVGKAYIAVVHGRPAWEENFCDLPLRADGDREHRTVIDKSLGKQSRTAFRNLGAVGNFAVLEAIPETGRTHQIRVHLASMGYPIVCDPLYGTTKPVVLSSFKRGWRGDTADERPLLSRLGLHAARLVLPAQAAGGEALELSAPFPRDLASLIKQMEKASGNSFGLEAYL